ncbi:DMT family transporter [Patulibacter americanus]|uniref:DMT family transporter n=1 Tax=Patulibacter americanus TaxID=588672 RepID=UPI0003B377B1|nr:DMT family transporter [Patulibacter americanus]
MGTPIGIPRRRAAPRLTRRAWITTGLAVVFVLCWSSGFIGAKLGSAEAPVATTLMWRFVPLALVLVPLALARAGHGLRGRTRGDVGTHVVVGLLSQSGYLLTVYGAIGLGVSTGTTALIDGLQPLVAAALVGPLLGVAVSARQRAGLALGLAGVVLVTWSDATAPTSTAPWWAYLVPFAGMLSLLASTFVERRTAVRTPPLAALAVHCTTSAVVFTVLALVTSDAVPPATSGFWLATAWLVVLPTFGGYGLYWLLVERIGVTPVNGLLFLIAPVTSVWGAAMFGEPLTLLTVSGLALALVAALAVSGAAAARSGGRSGRDRSPAGTTP